MKILVTGGAGYLGSVLVSHLLYHGHHVRVLDNMMHGGSSLLSVLYHPNFEFTVGDVRITQTVSQALEGMEGVVHLAAIVGDPACAREPTLARETNEEASRSLISLCEKAGVQRLVFASTCSNYGRATNPSEYMTEEAELRPVSLYAETKVAVEKALLGLQSDALTVTVLRLATLFGLSPRMRFDLTVNEFTKDLLLNGSIVVYGEQFWRPYVHVLDAARAMTAVLEAPVDKVQRQVFNVGDTSQNYQKEQLVQLIAAELDEPVEVQHVHKEEDPRDYKVSFSKISNVLDFHTTRTVTDGIREIIDAIKQSLVTDVDNPRYKN